MKKIKVIPQFANEDEEREFWDTHDTTGYFDTDSPVSFDLSHLKLTSKPITVRLPETLLYRLKLLANKKDVPYQSLIKIYLDEKVQDELNRSYKKEISEEVLILRDKERKNK